MIDVWVADIDAVGVIPAAQLSFLDESEIARWKKLRRPEDRRRFLIGRIMLRKALSALVAEEPDAWRFAFGAGGKPRLDDAHGVDDVSFNVSHSGNAVVVAVSCRGEVGVDIERLEESASSFDCVFTDSELDELDKTPAVSRWRDTLKMWTVKEAYAKLLGVDPSLDVFDFEVSPSPWRVIRSAPSARAPSRVHLETHELAVGGKPYSLALASLLGDESAEPRARVRMVDPLAPFSSAG